MTTIRVLMMGTGPFAVPTFQSLLDSSHRVLALVTRPAPESRGRRPAPLSPMRLACPPELPLLDPPDINAAETQRQLAELHPDLLVVCDYGQILSRTTLEIAPLGGINLHGSLLPKYRGAAPVNWALLQGDSVSGVSVIHMTPRLDAGPCLVRRETPIDPDEDAVQLEGRLAELGVAAVRQSIELLTAWDRSSSLGETQDPKLATRAPRLTKGDGEVDWRQPATRIRNQVRAFKPWPGTYTYWNEEGRAAPLRLILDEVQLPRHDPTIAPAGNSRAAMPGEVVCSDGHKLEVATGSGTLAITRIQPAGKRVMAIAEFLHGHRVTEGSRLGAGSASTA